MDISIQSSQTINGKTVTTRQLECLLTVEETGSQTAAAKRLGISVPVLHKYISSIEDAAGEPVVKTTPAGSKLTPAGEKIASLARSMNYRCETKRDFTICCSPVTEDLVASAVTSSKVQNVRIIVADDDYSIRMMREDRADVAIIDDPLFLYEAEEFRMEDVGYMGMVYVDNGPTFIRYRYGAQRVAFLYLDSIGKEYSVESESLSLPEMLGSGRSFFIEEFMLTRRNLRLKSAVDPKKIRHVVTAIYRDEDSRVARVVKAMRSRLI